MRLGQHSEFDTNIWENFTPSATRRRWTWGIAHRVSHRASSVTINSTLGAWGLRVGAGGAAWVREVKPTPTKEIVATRKADAARRVSRDSGHLLSAYGPRPAAFGPRPKAYHAGPLRLWSRSAG